MEDISFDGKTYKVETFSSSKRNPQLDNAVSLRIQEEEGEQRAAIWEMMHTDEKHLLSLERDEEIPDLSNPDQQFSVTGSDFIALQHFLRQFDEYRDIKNKNHILTTDDPDMSDIFEELVKKTTEVSDDGSRDLLESMIQAISSFSEEVDEIEFSDEVADKEMIRAHSMLKLASVRQGCEKLNNIIADEEDEDECQTLLENHTWMLGNKYVEKLDRELLYEGEVDFALKSVDGFLDIIELKRPDMNPVKEDPSHDTYYPRAELTKSITQLSNYVHEAERNQDRIAGSSEARPVKPRGIIIIGSDLDDEEREGLKIVESHLDRIEIITYTDLLKRGRRVENLYERDGELELITEEDED